MVAYRLAELQFGLGAKGFAGITQIDAPPNPKVAQFFKEFHNAGGGSSGTSHNCWHVQRTAKYNKALGKVKKNLQRNLRPGITSPAPAAEPI
jgi:hypothetical protein